MSDPIVVGMLGDWVEGKRREEPYDYEAARERVLEAMEAISRMAPPIYTHVIQAVDHFTPVVNRISWGLRANDVLWTLMDVALPPVWYRPDGRKRRTGHRHRGTKAWAKRHGQPFKLPNRSKGKATVTLAELPMFSPRLTPPIDYPPVDYSFDKIAYRPRWSPSFAKFPHRILPS